MNTSRYVGVIIGATAGFFLNLAGLFTTPRALAALAGGVTLLLIVHVIGRAISH
jgi:hypothetical protein